MDTTSYKKYMKYKNKYLSLRDRYLNLFDGEGFVHKSHTSNKNKFLNLRKQIEEFNLILDDRKTFGFIDPKNKNKYLSLRDIYLNLFRAEPYQFLRNRDGVGFVNKSHTSNKNKFLNLRKQIEEFNLILDDIDPKNKNKYMSLLDSHKQIGGTYGHEECAICLIPFEWAEFFGTNSKLIDSTESKKPISIDDFSKVIELEKCGHVFHVDCLRPILFSTGICPICRTKFSNVNYKVVKWNHDDLLSAFKSNNSTVLDLSNKSLNIDDIKVIAKGLTYNNKLKKLILSNDDRYESVYHGFYTGGKGFNEITDEALKELYRGIGVNRSIEEVYLSSTNIKNIQFIIKPIISNDIPISVLDLSNNDISKDGIISIIDLISKNTTLKHLDLSDKRDKYYYRLNCIGKYINKYIKKFSLALANNTTLLTLNLRGNNLESTTTINYIYKAFGIGIVDYLGFFKRKINRTLQILDLEDTHHGSYPDPDMLMTISVLLGVNTSLVKLNLTDNHIDNINLEHLSIGLRNNKTLQILLLKNNRFDKKSMSIFAESLIGSAITELDVSHNNLGDSTALGEVLSETNIIELDISFCRITDMGIISFMDRIDTNNKLTKLNLSNNWFKIYGGIAIGGGLIMNSSIKILDLTRNNIGDEGGRSIAYSLAFHNSTLEELRLGATNIGIDTGEILKEAMINNKTLRKLNLADICHRRRSGVPNSGKQLIEDSRISNIVMTSIGIGLAHSNLVYLNLSSNLINTDTLKVIAKSLETNNKLEKLKLKLNELTNEDGIYLADAIRVNRTLVELDLWHNNLEYDGILAILVALKDNPNTRITKLSLDYNTRSNDSNHYRRILNEYASSNLSLDITI